MDDSSTFIQPNTSVERMLVPTVFERARSQVLLQNTGEVSSAHMDIASANITMADRNRNERANRSMHASVSSIEALTFTLPVESSQE